MAPYSIIWHHMHHMAPYGTILHHVAPYTPYGTILHHMAPHATHGTIFHHMAPYGTMLHNMAPYAPYGTIFHLMAPYGTIFHHMAPCAPYGTIWHYIAPCGTIYTIWHDGCPSGGLRIRRVWSRCANPALATDTRRMWSCATKKRGFQDVRFGRKKVCWPTAQWPNKPVFLPDLCISHGLLMDFSWTSGGLLMDFWWTSHGLLVDFSRTSHGLLMDFWWTSHGLLMDFLWFTDEGIRTPKQHKKNWAAHPNSLCQHDCIPSGCQALNLRVCFQSQRSHSLGVMLDLDLLRVP